MVEKNGGGWNGVCFPLTPLQILSSNFQMNITKMQGERVGSNALKIILMSPHVMYAYSLCSFCQIYFLEIFVCFVFYFRTIL